MGARMNDVKILDQLRNLDVAGVAESVLNHLHLADMLGLVAALFYIATYAMKTMVPLRVAGILSNAFFLSYGYLNNSLPTFFLYLVLLPLNCVRLYQMVQLVKKVREASQGDLSMDWIKPFMHKRDYRKGDVLFRKGDQAEEMFYTLTGEFRVSELGLAIPPGQIVGELGFLAPDNRRTATVECIEDGRVLTITYDKVRELYFQNPEFGFYFLKLASERLLDNVARLEKALADRDRKMIPET
jgi:hypothetical protein